MGPCCIDHEMCFAERAIQVNRLGLVKIGDEAGFPP
jgi:hypothetical protein